MNASAQPDLKPMSVIVAEQARMIAKSVRDTCLLEIRSLKPGNVGLHGDGHDMTAEHFVKSAHAMAEPIALPDKKLGERVLHAVNATREAVDCNTNLGIVLLAAPLVQATWRSLALPVKIPLRATLHEVLQGSDQQDAAMVYQAIRIANPGGLGNVTSHDVRDAPTITLLQAMREAAGRDALAMEYCNDYARVFAIGVTSFTSAASHGMSEEWATTACYLEWLSHVPDTHVARKHGMDAARQLCEEALEYRYRFVHASRPEKVTTALIEWDQKLKQRGINPGTSADLTVASVLAYRLQHWLQSQQVTRCEGNVSLA
ncbi:MAG: triphosphoribosyl-dephospho-CoA synthase [Burkholderiales bacterium]